MRKKVGILFGGQSPERDVSRIAAYFIIKYMDKELYEPIPIWVDEDGVWNIVCGEIKNILDNKFEEMKKNKCDLLEDLKEMNMIFPIVFGTRFGGDGTINGTLDHFNISYVGSNYITATACMDKVSSKLYAKELGVNIAKYILVHIKEQEKKDKILKRVHEEIGYPCVVKPVCGGSSFGVSFVNDEDELIKGLKKAFVYDERVLIEKYIKGREVMIAIIGTKDIIISDPGEIIYQDEILDYKGKYISETTQTIMANDLCGKLKEEVKRQAKKIYRGMNASCYARLDFFIEEGSEKIIFNEINTMPVIAEMSIFSKLIYQTGLNYKELLNKIIEAGFEKYDLWKSVVVEIPKIDNSPKETATKAK
ncbi:MAG: D-alanine--D-alanine ligase [Marinisporobacter sp.]|jgi:D-alanine-D-alanine ligase|nr:D-alanine--D-alanine ligase [Marinisporobacter sp.]